MQGGGTSPAGLDWLDHFGDQVMNIQKCYACIYISFARVKVNGAAQKREDTQASICPPSCVSFAHTCADQKT